MQERIDYKKINFKVARKYFEGKNVVFTGRGFLARGELMRLARQAGAQVDSIVTKKCDILIVGEKPGSKLRKARILGCKIISTVEFKDILEGNYIDNLSEDGVDKEIFNIETPSYYEEKINISNKNIFLGIKNDFLKEKTIRNIRRNNGNIIENIDENIDVLVYQPISEYNELVNKARKLNILTITVGVFNKKL